MRGVEWRAQLSTIMTSTRDFDAAAALMAIVDDGAIFGSPEAKRAKRCKGATAAALVDESSVVQSLRDALKRRDQRTSALDVGDVVR